MHPNLYERYTRIYRAPDDEGAGGGDESAGESDEGSGGNTGGEGGSGNGGSGGQAGFLRPDWFPEAMWGDGSQFASGDGSLDTSAAGTALAEAYKNAQNKIFTRKDDLKKEVLEEIQNTKPEGVPESPDKYEFSKEGLSLPEGMDIEFLEDSPLTQWFKQTAYDKGLKQDEFNELVQQYVAHEMSMLPNYEKEKEALGEYADMRVERVNGWLQANLTPEAYEGIESIAVTAKSIKALEEVMQLAGEPAFNVTTDGNMQEQLTRDDLLAMQKDPRYWRDNDNAYIAKVQAGWQKLAGRAAAG